MTNIFLLYCKELCSTLLPILGAGLITFLLYRLGSRKNHGLHILGMTLFCCILALIFDITGIPHYTTFRPEINGGFNLIPFAEGTGGLFQYTANAVMFVPVGFFLPLLWQQFIRPLYTIGVGLLLSLGIELIQLFTFRATDIDDLMMNTLGAALGYLLYRLLRKPLKTLLAPFQISWSLHRLAGFEYLICILLPLALTFLL